VGRSQRYVESGTMYEICFRARASLPLVAYKLMNFIIYCTLARVQRDDKVILCHDIWNGSHPHLIVVSKDAQQLINFYSEIQKKITDCIKRLLGLRYLNIWEGRPTVIKIADLEAAKERIAYLYANPAQDNLEDSIDKFPGVSSWSIFESSLNNLDAKSSKWFPCIKLPTIPRLSGSSISAREDEEVVNILKEKNKSGHCLEYFPNEWMRCFGVSSGIEVSRINTSIVSLLVHKEAVARQKRTQNGKPLMGAALLRRQEILKTHEPKKRGQKIFIFTSINQLRMDFIEQVNSFCHSCRDCYRRWKNGELTIQWPPGAFRPPLRPLVSLLPN